MHPEFTGFPKIPRLHRDLWVLEKLDGTNAQVRIIKPEVPISEFGGYVAHVNGHLVWAGSRTRWITPEADNHGWAKWVRDNAEELLGLGQGSHFGEWWGSGINRGYGLQKGEKRFSLFNVGRWHEAGKPSMPTGSKFDEASGQMISTFNKEAPACCRVVPILWRGNANHISFAVEDALSYLRLHGSQTSPGYMNPEGIVAYHVAANQYFKVTLQNDDKPKGQ